MSGTSPHLISMIDIRASGAGIACRRRVLAGSRRRTPRPGWRRSPAPEAAAIPTPPVAGNWQGHGCAGRSRFSPPAIPLPPFSFIAAKRPISRPAQNARPSPDNTIARRPFSGRAGWKWRPARQTWRHRARSSCPPAPAGRRQRRPISIPNALFHGWFSLLFFVVAALQKAVGRI